MGQILEEDKAKILSVRNEPGTSAPPPQTMSKPHGNRSRDRRVNFAEAFDLNSFNQDHLQAYSAYFHESDDDSPGGAESSQSSVSINQMLSEQYMAVYTAKVR